MKTRTKWILGILISLVILAVLAGIGYLVFYRWNSHTWMMGPRVFIPGDGPRDISPKDLPRFQPFQDMPMHRYWAMPVRGGIGFLPLRILGWLFSPGLLLLIVIVAAAFLFGRKSRKGNGATQISPPPAQPAEPAVVKACSNCSRKVNEDWSHCPYCGNALE